MVVLTSLYTVYLNTDSPYIKYSCLQELLWEMKLTCTTSWSTCVMASTTHMWGMEETVMVIMWPMRFQSAEEEQLLLPGQLEQRFVRGHVADSCVYILSVIFSVLDFCVP